jgi:integrase
MPRRVPQYPKKAHSTGQARIKIKGKPIYLGKFGSPESYAKFHKTLAEYHATGELPRPTSDKESTAISVSVLVAQHNEWAILRYVKNGQVTTEPQHFIYSAAPAVEFFGQTLVDDFGPRMLLTCRQKMVDAGLCRAEVNKRLGRIKRIFKWGVSRELVRPETFHALRAVEGLRKGEARETDPIDAVAIERVEAISSHVMPQVWAMIQLQLHTSMRPGEVCRMRTRDIHEKHKLIPKPLVGQCWVYIPESHKTEHHKRERIIFIGPQAQEILREWLQPNKRDAYLFSPADAVRFLHAKRAVDAKWAGKNKSKAKGNAGGERYTTGAYDHAITRGCEHAFNMPRDLRVVRTHTPPPERRSLTEQERKPLMAAAAAWRAEHCWHANQLRHTAATLIRQKYGAELARVILGHANLSTTEIYAERDFAAAAKAIAEIG